MRDSRDPVALGQALFELHEATGNKHLSVTYDNHAVLLAQVERHSPTESTVDSTIAQYKQEMTEQAATGDAAARVVCEEHGWAYASTQAHSDDESASETYAQNGHNAWSNVK